MTKPSSRASSSASAKLWLPPVSSNGLNRTSPIRWNASRPVDSSAPVRAISEFEGVRDLADALEVRLEDGFEISAVVALGQADEAVVQLGRPPQQDVDDDREEDEEHREEHDGCSDIRLHERVQIDRRALRWIGPSLAARPPLQRWVLSSGVDSPAADDSAVEALPGHGQANTRHQPTGSDAPGAPSRPRRDQTGPGRHDNGDDRADGG